ncbi:restriction endonuclease subunit S [Xanthomonas euvesicatoria]|uniref:restriction endonuclease subunit S n=1 Tax=Xanthomonas euvesicatoria TaxID=456327 RepID=UPI003A0FFE3C
MELNERGANYLYGEQSMTVLGLIPSDWSVTTVGDEFHVQLGKMLDSEKNMGKPKLFLGNRAVQWGRIDINDIGEILMSRSDLQRYRLEHGDLLVCEGGEVGRSAIWRGQLEECYYQKALHRLRTKRGYSHEFMAAVLEQFARTGKLQNYVTQTSIAHLPKEKLVALPIPKPASEDEQYRISQAICDADALIESLEQLLTKKRQIKQGAMQELLTGKRRLPGFKGRWQSLPLNALAKIQRGASPRPIDDPIWFDDSSSVGWVRISDVTQSGIYLHTTTQRLSEAGIRKSRFVRAGNLVMSICATVGRPIITALDTCIHDGFVVFDALSVDKKFLYYALLSIEDKWSMHGQTGSQMNLNTGLIKRAAVPVPDDVREQAAIAEVLSDIDADIAALEARLTKARALKEAMSQALLTGRIRLVRPAA